MTLETTRYQAKNPEYKALRARLAKSLKKGCVIPGYPMKYKRTGTDKIVNHRVDVKDLIAEEARAAGMRPIFACPSTLEKESKRLRKRQKRKHRALLKRK